MSDLSNNNNVDVSNVIAELSDVVVDPSNQVVNESKNIVTDNKSKQELKKETLEKNNILDEEHIDFDVESLNDSDLCDSDEERDMLEQIGGEVKKN